MLEFFFFFFSSRRRHTRFSRDWSSDVCSSDLGKRLPRRTAKSVDDYGAHVNETSDPGITSRVDDSTRTLDIRLLVYSPGCLVGRDGGTMDDEVASCDGTLQGVRVSDVASPDLDTRLEVRWKSRRITYEHANVRSAAYERGGDVPAQVTGCASHEYAAGEGLALRDSLLDGRPRQEPRRRWRRLLLKSLSKRQPIPYLLHYGHDYSAVFT